MTSTTLALALTAIPSCAQTVTCAASDIACRVQHNDAVVLGSKLDELRSDIQTLTKALQSSGLVAAKSGATANTSTVPTADALTSKYFPSDVGVAAFPSPENSRIVRLNGIISGRPYLMAADGSVHQLVAQTAGSPHGYNVNGHASPGGGSDGYNQLLVRQGQVYAQTTGGQWQHFNPSMGAMYNSALPDAFAMDASGQTTSTVATSKVTMPALPTRMSPAPGTSGKTLRACASGCGYTTISAAIRAAAAGDTVSIGPGTWKEAPPAWTVPLKIVFELGASMDLTGLTGSLAHGKGGLVPAADSIIINPVITGVALDQTYQSTAAIRPDQGAGYLEIQGGTLSGNQNGVAGGDVPVVVTIKNTVLKNNGLGDGFTHNIYLSGGIISLTLNNITSVSPNGGHAVKSRAFATAIVGGTFDAGDAAVIDLPNGSVAAATIDGAVITKPAGAPNHVVLDYATENTSSGNGGFIVSGTTFNLLCDSPFFNVGGGSVVTLDASTTITGNKPTTQGGIVKRL